MQIRNFLEAADQLFPIPLSTKHDLEEFAKKLCDKGEFCAGEWC